MDRTAARPAKTSATICRLFESFNRPCEGQGPEVPVVERVERRNIASTADAWCCWQRRRFPALGRRGLRGWFELGSVPRVSAHAGELRRPRRSARSLFVSTGPGVRTPGLGAPALRRSSWRLWSSRSVFRCPVISNILKALWARCSCSGRKKPNSINHSATYGGTAGVFYDARHHFDRGPPPVPDALRGDVNGRQPWAMVRRWW